MITGCYTATGTGYSRFKLGAKFTAYKTLVSGGDVQTYGWHSYELGGWLTGTPSADSRDVDGGETVYSDSDLTTPIGTVSQALTFCAVAMSSIGGGSLSLSGSTIYGGLYVVRGSNITFVATPDSGKKEIAGSFMVNGVASVKSITIDSDIVAVVAFCPLSYSVRHENAVGGGASIVSVGGVLLPAGNTKTGVSAGTEVTVTASAHSGKEFLYSEIDGVRSVENPIRFTVYDRSNDDTFNVKCVFGNVSSATDRIIISGDGTVSVRQGDSVVPVTDGEFSAATGLVYTVSAVPASGKRVDGFYENGRLVSSKSSYSFVQDGANREITVVFSNQRSIELNLFSGADINARTETWNGCSCGVTAPSGTTVGTYTFSPNAATGYMFVRLYIEDRDGTGKGRVIPAGQSYAVNIDFNARVVAVFAANDTPVEPADEDQGDATHGVYALKVWEGSSAPMTATWRSRRNVFTKPVSLSCGRVLANGYPNGLPLLKVACYESPNTSDGSEISRVVSNQDSFRLPGHRPDKYIEIGVLTDRRVLEIAVSTSMEGLWQTSS